jgi:serine phosphatase RsbU (regulator of sigma subunit)
MNTVLHERQLEDYYTLCSAVFDFTRRKVVLANSGLPYPIRYSAKAEHDERTSGLSCVSQIGLLGIPLGSSPEASYGEATFDLAVGDAYAFCSDGVFEARDTAGREFGATRL